MKQIRNKTIISDEAMLILDIASRVSGIDVNLIQNPPDGKRKIIQVRQICHYIMKKYTAYSLAKIGYEIGEKDHATVLYSFRTIQNLFDTNTEDIVKLVTLIEKEIEPFLNEDKIITICFKVFKDKPLPQKNINYIKYPFYKLTEIGDSFLAIQNYTRQGYKRLTDAMRKYSKNNNIELTFRVIDNNVWVWRIK